MERDDEPRRPTRFLYTGGAKWYLYTEAHCTGTTEGPIMVGPPTQYKYTHRDDGESLLVLSRPVEMRERNRRQSKSNHEGQTHTNRAEKNRAGEFRAGIRRLHFCLQKYCRSKKNK